MIFVFQLAERKVDLVKVFGLEEASCFLDLHRCYLELMLLKQHWDLKDIRIANSVGFLLEHALDIPTVVGWIELLILVVAKLLLLEGPEEYFGALDTPIVQIPKHPFLVKIFEQCNFLAYGLFSLMSRTYIIMAIILFIFWNGTSHG